MFHNLKVGLAISYALGITSKLSGLVSAFAETERELVKIFFFEN
jgi:hypothetical protein